ncbi:MAG TPA: GNAT family N-acetyltransferase [Micromonosporaceae bacterium]|nr:GNAT family N-acetyltransferase [Micromonosporaceae bacterium]
MSKFRTRPYTNADAPAVAELHNVREVAVGGDPTYSAAEIRDIVVALARDTDADTRLVFAEDGTLVASAVVAPPPDGGVIAETFGGVHPDWMGRGIGRELVTWEIARLRELRDRIAPGAAWTIDAGSSIKETQASHLFERFGMRAVRYFFEMVAPTAGVTPTEMPAGFRVVAYTPDLARPLYEAIEEAFRDHWGHEDRPFDQWRAWSIDSELFRAEHSRIAFDGDDIAAAVLCYDNAVGHHYIGSVSTRRPWRKRGLASALMSETIAVAAADGKTVTALGVDADNPTGALGVYERLGFAVRQRWVVHRLILD